MSTTRARYHEHMSGRIRAVLADGAWQTAPEVTQHLFGPHTSAVLKVADLLLGMADAGEIEADTSRGVVPSTRYRCTRTTTGG